MQGFETLIERQVSRLFIRARFTLPESSPVSPDVPVTQLVDETFNRLPGFSCVIGVERGGGGYDPYQDPDAPEYLNQCGLVYDHNQETQAPKY